MGRHLIFLYLDKSGKEYILSDIPRKELLKKVAVGEILRSFSTLSAAFLYLEKSKISATHYLEKKRDYFDTHHREKLRESKLGEKNPNAKGLSEKHRRNISKSMKGKNLSQFNVNFGKRRTLDIRAKISHTKIKQNAQRRRRWALDEHNNEHLVFFDLVLPIGWTWGRKRSSLRKKR